MNWSNVQINGYVFVKQIWTNIVSRINRMKRLHRKIDQTEWIEQKIK